jgi:membrane associated rhomboid family serine protease
MHEPNPYLISRLNDSDSKWILKAYNKILSLDTPPKGLEEYVAHEGTAKDVLAFKLALEPNFLKNVVKIKDQMEPIEYQYRYQKLQSIQDEITNRNISKFGFVSREARRWATWLTYQFIHAGFLHLISNMLILLIFGGALEKKIGCVWVLLGYVFSGFAGAYLFYLFDPQSAIPLVGSSASVTGLIGSYLILEKKRFIPFFYFLGFHYIGKIYLPSFILFFYFFIDDLASWLSQDPMLGSGVAHLAHVGGFFFGVLFALTLSFKIGSQKRRSYAG